MPSGGRGENRRRWDFTSAIAGAALALIFANVYFSATLNKSVLDRARDGDKAPAPVSEQRAAGGRARIALMSSHVPNRGVDPPPRLKDTYMEHLVGKACYCHLWGYDFIFNTTYGFDHRYPAWHWLNYGTWHRVPHVAARIRDYDWIFYTDTDVAIKDLTRPIESFLREFELYGKDNVQLFVPTDRYKEGQYLFSAFAFLLRNSSFGRTLLRHWDAFARGMCPRGNINTTVNGRYHWLDTDQPGLWYAMMRTYGEFFPDRVPPGNLPQCNDTTGVFEIYNPGWNTFFQSMANLTKGSNGLELAQIPDDQPFVFSGLPIDGRSGLALQLNWGVEQRWAEKYTPGSFALHQKDPAKFPEGMQAEIDRCRRQHGCYARYNERDELQIGCGDRVYL